MEALPSTMPASQLMSIPQDLASSSATLSTAPSPPGPPSSPPQLAAAAAAIKTRLNLKSILFMNGFLLSLGLQAESALELGRCSEAGRQLGVGVLSTLATPP